MADKISNPSTDVGSAPPPAETASIMIPPPIVPVRKGTSTSSAASGSIPQLRDDLSRAQQERSELQRRLDEATQALEKLKTTSKSERKRATQVTAELAQLSLRLKDRDEEARGKVKLLNDVQDEMVTLNLQLNIAEEEVKKLRRENQELVDRWMKHKAREADQMNTESRF